VGWIAEPVLFSTYAVAVDVGERQRVRLRDVLGDRARREALAAVGFAQVGVPPDAARVRRAGEHVDAAVAVDIRGVQVRAVERHALQARRPGSFGGAALRRLRPPAVRAQHVEPAVAVEVVEGQAERLADGHARGRIPHPHPCLLRDVGEPAVAVVAVEPRERAGEVLRPAVGPPPADEPEILAAIEVAGPLDVVADEEVEIAVAVDVCQRHRGGPQALGEAVAGGLGEASFAVVQEQPGAEAEPVHQQVEVAVAIHVGHDGPGAGLTRAGGSPGVGLALEPPAAAVQVQGIGALEAREVQVAPAVSIHIAQGHAGSVLEDAVVGHGRLVDGVRESHARVGRRHPREAGSWGTRLRQRVDAGSRQIPPFPRGSGVLGQGRQWELELGPEGQSQGAPEGRCPGEPGHGDLPVALAGFRPRREGWTGDETGPQWPGAAMERPG